MPSPISTGPATNVTVDAAPPRCYVETKAPPASAAIVAHQEAEQPATGHTTTGAVCYAQQPPNGEEPRRYVYEVPEGQEASNLNLQQYDVSITDLHSSSEKFTLQHNGFQLEQLELPSDVDWEKEEQVHIGAFSTSLPRAQVKERVYPLVDALLKRVTGATRTIIFDHTLRNGRINPNRQGAEKHGQPVPMVHVDYTTKSGVERLDALVPKEDAQRLKKTPFAAIQVWRPLKGPVDESPLAMIDASTVDKEDLMQYVIHFPGRSGYNYAVKHNPKHKFYYAKGMNVDEAYVFVCYDSRAGRARFTPHTGLKDYGTSPDAPPRESVELRAYCFWEDLEPQEVAMQL